MTLLWDKPRRDFIIPGRSNAIKVQQKRICNDCSLHTERSSRYSFGARNNTISCRLHTVRRKIEAAVARWYLYLPIFLKNDRPRLPLERFYSCRLKFSRGAKPVGRKATNDERRATNDYRGCWRIEFFQAMSLESFERVHSCGMNLPHPASMHVQPGIVSSPLTVIDEPSSFRCELRKNKASIVSA